MILVRPGDLLISGINAAKGAIAIFDSGEKEPIAATIHYSAYAINRSGVNPRYLHLLLRSPVFREILDHNLPDGIKTELKAKRLLAIRIPLPSLEEQQRIVARIEELTGRLRQAASLHYEAMQETAEFFQAELDNAFAKASAVPRIPLQAVLVGRPRNGWSPPAKYHAEEGTAVLMLSAVTGFRYDGSKIKWTSAPTRADAHYWLKPGELLITRSNTPELVGHAAIYDGTPTPCICPDLIMKMSVDPAKADVRFIHYWLQTSDVRRFVMGRARGTSRSMKKIAQRDVQEIPVPQLPLREQARIVARLNAIRTEWERLRSAQAAIQSELESFLPALLAKAFRGEL